MAKKTSKQKKLDQLVAKHIKNGLSAAQALKKARREYVDKWPDSEGNDDHGRGGGSGGGSGRQIRGPKVDRARQKVSDALGRLRNSKTRDEALAAHGELDRLIPKFEREAGRASPYKGPNHPNARMNDPNDPLARESKEMQRERYRIFNEKVPAEGMPKKSLDKRVAELIKQGKSPEEALRLGKKQVEYVDKWPDSEGNDDHGRGGGSSGGGKPKKPHPLAWTPGRRHPDAPAPLDRETREAVRGAMQEAQRGIDEGLIRPSARARRSQKSFKLEFKKVADPGEDSDKPMTVVGWASVVTTPEGKPIVDFDDDIIEFDELEKAFAEFAKTGGTGRGGYMHDNIGGADIIGQITLSREEREALGFGPGQEGAIIKVRVHDPELKKRIRSGALNEFSLAGLAEPHEVDKGRKEYVDKWPDKDGNDDHGRGTRGEGLSSNEEPGWVDDEFRRLSAEDDRRLGTPKKPRHEGVRRSGRRHRGD